MTNDQNVHIMPLPIKSEATVGDQVEKKYALACKHRKDIILIESPPRLKESGIVINEDFSGVDDGEVTGRGEYM